MNKLVLAVIAGLVTAMILTSSVVYSADYDDSDAATGTRSGETIDFAKFMVEFKNAGYNYDGQGVSVSWSPSSGCWAGGASGTHAEKKPHYDDIPNVDGNTPKRTSDGNYQYQICEGESDVRLSNVNFKFTTADVKTCGNSDWYGSFSGDEFRSAELQFKNTGSLTVTNCSFEATLVSPYFATEDFTVENCQFKNNWDTYAFKDIIAKKIKIEGCSFTDLGCVVLIKGGSTPIESIEIVNNSFKDIDTYAPETERYKHGLIQFMDTQNADHQNTKFTFEGNTVSFTETKDEGDGFGIVRVKIDSSKVPSATIMNEIVTKNVLSVFPFVNNGTVLVYIDPDNGKDDQSGDKNAPVKTLNKALDKAGDKKFINLYFVGGGSINGEVPDGKFVSLALGSNKVTSTVTVKTGGYLAVSSGVLYVDDDTLRSQVIGTAMKPQSSSSSDKVEVKTDTVETVAEKTGTTTAIVSEIKSKENVSQAIIEAVTQISTVKTVTETTSSTANVTIQVVVPVAENTKKVEVSNAAVTALKESGAELKVSDSGGRTVSLNNDVLETLSSKTGAVEVIVTPEPTALTTAQKSVVGTDTVIDVSAYVGGVQVSELKGTATISVPYQAKGTVKVTYVKDDGSVENVPCTYSGGVVTFTTEHFSLYVFSDSFSTPSFIPVPDNGDDFPGYIPTQNTDSASDDSAKIAVLVGAIVVVLVAIVALVHRSR